MQDVKKLRIAIAGSFGFMDIGDEAMLTEDLKFILNDLSIPAGNIHLFGHDAEYVSNYHQHPLSNCHSSEALIRHGEAISLRKERPLRRARKFAGAIARGHRPPFPNSNVANVLSSCDVALITGGGTINSRDARAFSLHRMSKMIQAFRNHNLGVFISGQTIGPLGEYVHHDKIAAEIIEAADVLTVRDHIYSKRYLDVIGMKPKELICTFDDAYTLDYEQTVLPKETANFLSSETPTVAVNITEYTAASAEQLAFIASFCDWLVGERKVQVLLLSHTPKDLVRLFQINDMSSLSCRDKIHVPDTRYWTGEQLKKAISGCKVAVGGRYHFIVFAGTSNTPFVGMCGNHYSYIKQNGFADPLGLSRFILTERETWDAEKLRATYVEAEELTLELSEKFVRPSDSMKRFGSWLSDQVE